MTDSLQLPERRLPRDRGLPRIARRVGAGRAGRPPAEIGPAPDQPGAAIAAKLLSSVSFALMAASAKAAGEFVDSYVVVLVRSCVILVALVPLMVWRGVPLVGRARLVLHLRCLFGTAALHLYYFALQKAPLAEVVVLANTAPLFVPLLGFFFLGEHPSPRLFLLLALGFGGVVTIAGPELGGLDVGVLAAAGGGLFVACGLVCLKKLTTREHPLTIVFTFSLWTLVTSLPWFAGGAPGSVTDAALPLVLVGVFAIGGQIFLTRALSFSAAGAVVALNYFSVLIAFLLGLALWGETPTPRTLAGAAMIIAACVLTSRSIRSLVSRRGAATEADALASRPPAAS